LRLIYLYSTLNFLFFMLNFLEIENFRCFENFKIEGLAQVNLFGGLNNSGKTALLEAFALATNHFNFLKDCGFAKIRNLQESKEDSIDNLFYKRENTREISLRSNLKDPERELFTVNNSGSFIEIEANYLFKLSELSHNILTIFCKDNTGYIKYTNTIFCYITSKSLSFPNDLNLPQALDNAELKDRKAQLMQILHCIDPKITDARTFATNGESIYLRRSVEERWFPMENLGDAVQKVLNYALNIYALADNTATEKVLIIDEIENGLHYTVQESFWEQLFNLAKQFNIQIFAATHSLEMIKAYLNTIKKLGENAVSNKYWELFRNAKNGKIMATDRDIEQLEYVLSTSLNFRGE